MNGTVCASSTKNSFSWIFRHLFVQRNNESEREVVKKVDKRFPLFIYDQNFSRLTCSKQWPETDSEGEKSRDASMDQGEVVCVER